MECLYVPELTASSVQCMITGEEFRHLWALRLKEGEMLMLTNGNGLCAKTQVIKVSKNDAMVQIREILPEYGEKPYKLGLALGILDNRDRMEFALEKSVELGITDFYPILCEFSQKHKISTDRLVNKAIASIKQCKRSWLPVIHDSVTVEKLVGKSLQWSKILLADELGSSLTNNIINSSCLVFVGTEGGFSSKEIDILKSDLRTELIGLGNRRLRAETASTVLLGLLI